MNSLCKFLVIGEAKNFASLEKWSRGPSMCNGSGCTFLFFVNITQLVFEGEYHYLYVSIYLYRITCARIL